MEEAELYYDFAKLRQKGSAGSMKLENKWGHQFLSDYKGESSVIH